MLKRPMAKHYRQAGHCSPNFTEGIAIEEVRPYSTISNVSYNGKRFGFSILKQQHFQGRMRKCIIPLFVDFDFCISFGGTRVFVDYTCVTLTHSFVGFPCVFCISN